MTWIEATCPNCGTVECTPDMFELSVCDHKEASYYTFTCPDCLEHVQKHAEARVIELLIAEGVAPVLWSLPLELLESHAGPVLSVDDLLDFHIALEQPNWFETLTKEDSTRR